MPVICLITALPSEARPLIEHFRLSALGHKHLRLYHGANHLSNKERAQKNQPEVTLYLLQCGVGKLNAAANTAAMLQFLPNVTAVINLGICGSMRPVGETLLAHGIRDNASSQQWFPHLPSSKQLISTPCAQVLTVDSPNDNYSSDIAFDMEASGIIIAAIKVIDLAFIHSIKVVSDNHESGIERITGKSVTTLMANSIGVLENLIAALPYDALPATTDIKKLSQSLRARLHYSATEQHALNQLLHRHHALLGELPSEDSLLRHNTAKAVRKHLSDQLDHASVTY